MDFTPLQSIWMLLIDFHAAVPYPEQRDNIGTRRRKIQFGTEKHVLIQTSWPQQRGPSTSQRDLVHSAKITVMNLIYIDLASQS